MEADTSESVAPSRLQHYRPHLDGVRTVAVYLVVAFHAGLGLLAGGFIGVDIFFVLSGFLVTQILIRDIVAVGHVRRRQFYARRARRILPAAIITLIGTAIAYSIIASPVEMLNVLDAFRAAFFYVANWYFIRQSTNYFATDLNTNPVLHFWSLAVEEQFYLLWPMLLGAFYLITARFGRRRWWALRAVVIAAGGASAIAALQVATTNLDRAYYGTDTRAYQLLAGAALALTPQLLRLRSRNPRVPQWVSAVALAGLIVLATSLLHVGPITRGVITAVLVVILLAAIENARGGLAKQILSSRPFTYLGRISYGVYLWHWPVIVIAAHGHSLSPIELFAISAPTATALAAFSFHVIEHPIRVARALDQYKSPVIAIGFATSILCGVLVMPAILDSGGGSISAAGTPGVSRVTLLDWRVAKKDFPKLPDCLGKAVDQCTVVRGTGLRVVLMGDSNAWMWIPTFTELAKERGWTFSVAAFPGCPWQQTLHLRAPHPGCTEHQADWYGRVIPKLNPDLIILAHQAFDNPDYPFVFIANGRRVAPNTPPYEPALINASSAALRKLDRPGRNIVLLEPIPQPPAGDNPLSCLSAGNAPATCAFKASAQPTPLVKYYRTAGRQPGVTSIDLDRLVCPRFPTCDAIVNDIIVRPNADHVTATYARSLAPKIGALLPK